MAGYDASINVLLRGQSNLDRLITRIDQLDTYIQRINATPIDISRTAGRGAAADRLGVLQGRVQQLRDDYLELGEVQRRVANGTRTGNPVGQQATINQLRAQSELLETIARNSRIASAQFREMTIASSMASAQANAAGRERLAVLAEAFSSSGTRGRMENVRGQASLNVVNQLIAAGPTITRSEAALSGYLSELENIKALVLVTSSEYRALEEAIAGVNQELSQAGLRGQTSRISPVPTYGPAVELGSVKAIQMQQKYSNDLIASREKLTRISVNLDSLAISQIDKDEARNRLAQAFNALQENNLDLARRLGTEADRYARDARSKQVQNERLARQTENVRRLEEKANEKTAAYMAKVNAQVADDSGLKSWVDGFTKSADEAERLLGALGDTDKALINQFKYRQKPEAPYATRLGGGAEARARTRYQAMLQGPGEAGVQGLSVKLGGKEQLIEQQKYQDGILKSQNDQIKNRNIMEIQITRLQQLEQTYIAEQKKGVDIGDNLKKIQDIIAIGIKDQNYGLKQTVEYLGLSLGYYNAILGKQTQIAKNENQYRSGTSVKKTPAEIAESTRVNLIDRAQTVQERLIGLEGKGAQVASERAEIEAQILKLKQMENAASQKDLEIIAHQIKELRVKAREISNTIPKEQGQAPFLERMFAKPGGPLSRLPGTAQQKASAVQEGLVGGAFPLLFGQGVGASAGGLLGGVAGGLMGGGIGMGLSLLGTSIGGFLDQAVIKAQELGNALIMAGDNASKLRQNGAYYTADLEKQVKLLKEQGNFRAAEQLTQSVQFQTAGDVNGGITKAVAMSANELGKAWKGVQSAIGTTLGLLAAPFMYAITAVLRAVQGIFAIINLIVSGIGAGVNWLIDRIPLLSGLTDRLEESSLRGTEEYENQLAEINKQIIANEKNNKILANKNNILQGTLGKTKVEFELATKRAEAQQRAAELEKEIQDYRSNAATGTSELLAKAIQVEGQMRFKFAQQEKAILIANAREVYDAIIENNRNVAKQQKQNQIEYADLVRQNIRSQKDLDLDAARKVQDIRIEMKEKELQYTKQIADEELKAIKIADEQRSFQRGINASISGNRADSIINTVNTAIEKWRTGRREVEQEYAQKQQDIQLQAQKAEIALQRYKYDNALKIARANEDSQLKINKMQQQINLQNEEISRLQLERKRAELISEVNLLEDKAAAEYTNFDTTLRESGKYLTSQQRQQYELQRSNALASYNSFDVLRQVITNLFKDLSVKRLSPVGPAPKLTDPSAPVTAAQTDAAEQNKKYAEQITLLQKINGLNQNDLELAKALLDPTSKQLDQFNQTVETQRLAGIEREAYNRLIMEGTLPALAKEEREIEKIREAQLQSLDVLLEKLSASKENTPGSVIADAIAKLTEMRGAFNTQADSAIIGLANAYSPQARMTDEIIRLKEELTTLLDPVNQITKAAESIGQAFSESFKGVIDGSMTAQDALANFFKNIANYFLDMAGQVIAKMIEMAILNAVVGMLPGAAPSKGLNTAGVNAYASQTPILPYPNANGGMFMNGIQPFARGGIVNSPTLFKFANGGALQTGLMGEAGPEAVMPLKRGSDGRLGVDASGSGGGGSVNVTVNVDAGGSKVQGDSGRAGELGRAVSAAVQQEIVKQKRPGGLLA